MPDVLPGRGTDREPACQFGETVVARPAHARSCPVTSASTAGPRSRGSRAEATQRGSQPGSSLQAWHVSSGIYQATREMRYEWTHALSRQVGPGRSERRLGVRRGTNRFGALPGVAAGVGSHPVTEEWTREGRPEADEVPGCSKAVSKQAPIHLAATSPRCRAERWLSTSLMINCAAASMS
jgi:hypothetical protein